jgi:hypothetical protein
MTTLTGLPVDVLQVAKGVAGKMDEQAELISGCVDFGQGPMVS